MLYNTVLLIRKYICTMTYYEDYAYECMNDRAYDRAYDRADDHVDDPEDEIYDDDDVYLTYDQEMEAADAADAADDFEDSDDDWYK